MPIADLRSLHFGDLTDDQIVQRARRFADEEMLPVARDVDATDAAPETLLRRMADAGFFAAAGAGIEPAAMRGIVEAFAGGSLAPAFVWLQHQGALGFVTRTANSALAGQFAAALASGETRAGIGITGMFPPRPLTVVPTDTGYEVDGTVPWLTGWGSIDLVVLGALGPDDVVHYLLADAVREGLVQPDSIAAEPYDLIAARGARTHEVSFRAHPVPADRLLATVPRAGLLAGDAAGLAQNGALALGVAARAIALAGSEALAESLASARRMLDIAGPDALPAARATASDLAVRAAATLTATIGARSISRGTDAERLMREALFLEVFGTRPSIRAELLTRLAR